MAFFNRLAEVAEREGHHPDFCLKRWNHVSLSLQTHAIGGLSRESLVALAEMVERVRQLEGLPPAAGGLPQPAPESRPTSSRRRRPGQPRPADPSSA